MDSFSKYGTLNENGYHNESYNLDKSSWQKYVVYHFDLHDDCIY